jgi:hypothetical protein
MITLHIIRSEFCVPGTVHLLPLGTSALAPGVYAPPNMPEATVLRAAAQLSGDYYRASGVYVRVRSVKDDPIDSPDIGPDVPGGGAV